MLTWVKSSISVLINSLKWMFCLPQRFEEHSEVSPQNVCQFFTKLVRCFLFSMYLRRHNHPSYLKMLNNSWKQFDQFYTQKISVNVDFTNSFYVPLKNIDL